MRPTLNLRTQIAAIFSAWSFVILILLTGSFSGCGIERPAAVYRYGSNAGFDHSGVTGNCAACHEFNRPAPVASVVHGNGNDCVACHTPTSWLNVTSFDHTPTPTSCSSCHETVRPADTNWPEAPSLRTTHFLGNDCVSCHTPPSVSLPWKFSHQSATGDIGTCLPCHVNKGTGKHSGNPSYFLNGGTCATCHNYSRGWNAN